MSIRKKIIDIDDQILLTDGFDQALVGVCHQFGRPPVAVYDYEKVIKMLMKEGMTLAEAEDFWHYNQVGAGMGEYTPVFFQQIT